MPAPYLKTYPLHAILSGVVPPGAHREERAPGPVSQDVGCKPANAGPSNPAISWTSTSLAKLPALSIRQPWAWLILNAGKNIENRSRQSHYRGWFLIHASKGMTNREYVQACCSADECGFPMLRIPRFDSLQRGGIVGVAKLGNCVRGHDSPWFRGPWGLVLDEVKPLEFFPCNGTLGFFHL